MRRAGYLILLRADESADPEIAQLARSRDGWRVLADEHEMVATAEDALPMMNCGSVALLGQAFANASGPIEARDLAALTRSCWGAYVATSRAHSGLLVMRDPSGRMPCFSTVWRGWRLFAADLSGFGAVGWTSSGIDWANFAQLLADPRIRDGRTALEGVVDLLPGEAMNALGERKHVWSPSHFVREAPATVAEARGVLRDAVQLAVGNWASRSSRILHLFSGGLDSSIVLACMAEAGLAERVRCLHFTRGPGSELDEVGYAREVAARTGAAMVERMLAPSAIRLERASDLTHAPRPLGYAASIENDDAELEEAEDWDADVCFSAAGGDGLFYQLQTKVYCADYLRRNGVGPGLVRTAYDAARLTRSSFWSALGAGFKYRSRKFDPAVSSPNPYLADAAGEEAAGWFERHPWVREGGDLPPGKKLHIWALLDTLNFTYDYHRAARARTILPLVSQPVIEAVLRIPSYILSSRGMDRALVRDAFADMLPASVVRRTGKGAMDGYYAELCAANAALIRERLLGGKLASKKLLNTTRIAQALPERGDPVDGAETQLLKLFAAELWAEAW
jgi:asparagine synthase (glutamine-hydrolysing)